MRIKIGIYDFFTHLIGGSFLLTTLSYILPGLPIFSVNISNLSPSQVLILAIITYVMGYVMTPMQSIWYSFWVPKDMCQKAVSKLNQELSGMGVNLQIMDSYTLVAFIKRHSVDMAQDVEQYDAISVMLRNISFGFLLFSILLGVQGLFSSYAAPLFILLGFLCLFLSIMLIKEAVKYQTYFFRSIYQSVVALLVKPEQLSIRFQEKGILNHNPSIHEK